MCWWWAAAAANMRWPGSWRSRTKVQKVFVAPGNGGTALDSRMENINITEPSELLAWAATNNIALTVVGPEQPLAAGVVDLFRSKGMRMFGPTAAAAQLESSKAFSKAFMKPPRHSDGGLRNLHRRSSSARVCGQDGRADCRQGRWLGRWQRRGRGDGHWPRHMRRLTSCWLTTRWASRTTRAARASSSRIFDGRRSQFHRHVRWQKRGGDGDQSQDHKRLLDGDLGPNTGGMGAYSPAPVVTPDVHARAMREVILPTIKGMEKDGIPFTGFLYAGLMIETDGANKGQIKTLEFNCRMGDPETQPIMMRLKTDFFDVMWAATEPGAHGRLDKIELEWDRRPALGVVMAAHGYPLSPRKGDVITVCRLKSTESMTT